MAENQTTLYLLASTGIDLQNKPTFETEQSQETWFSSKRIDSGINYSYQRADTLSCRYKGNYDDLSEVDYCMFRNGNYGKWYYCMVIDKFWINPNDCEISFVIDAYETFMFDIRFADCLVEREHISGDWTTEGKPSFSNLLEEPLDTGEFKCIDSMDQPDNNINYAIFYAAGKMTPTGAITNIGDLNGGQYIGTQSMGLYTGARVSITEGTDVQSIAEQIESAITSFDIIGAPEAILGIVAVPEYMREPNIQTLNIGYANDRSIDGYAPKNAKLYTYPYCFLGISNNNGDASIYRWEMFDYGAQASFRVFSQLSMKPAALCYPAAYKGMSYNYDEGLMLTNFPQMPWISDNYQAQLVKNAPQLIGSAVGSLATMGAAAAYAGMLGPTIAMTIGAGASQNVARATDGSLVNRNYNVAGKAAYSFDEPGPNLAAGAAALNAARTLYNNAINAASLAMNPVAFRGHIDGEYLNVSLRRLHFTVKIFSVKREIAKVIDDFFTMYGYHVSRIKVPNIRTRPYWNYVKTAQCNIIAACSHRFQEQIVNLFNSGVTLWHVDKGARIKNYNMDNRDTHPVDPNPVEPDPPQPTTSMIMPLSESYGAIGVTSEFGWRNYPADPYHTGIDLIYPDPNVNTLGKPIKAVLPGVVYDVIDSPTGYGKNFKIRHSDTLSTHYAHCSALPFKEGRQVSQGQTVSNVGVTGLTSGPHLHFGVLENGQWVNPRNYLPF